MNLLLASGLLTMMFSGTPLFIIIFAAALLCFFQAGIDLSVVVIEMYRLAASPMLLALLLFAFAGFVLAESQASRRLVRLSTALMGRAPGGLAIVSLITCAFFTALTGASGVTIVALGGLMLPALIADNYPEKFSLGLLTTCGSLGLLFPPSLPLIIYAMVADINIADLFLAGVMPGVVMLVLLSLYSMMQGFRCGSAGAHEPFSFRELLAAFRDALWEVLLPVVVLGGIFSGFLALSEAAAITTIYVILIEVAVHREVGLKELPSTMMKTVVMVGAIVVILGASLAFNSFLIDQQVPNRILDFMRVHVQSKFTFLILLNLFLLAVGCVLNIFSALVIVVPLIVPIAKSYDVNLLHLGIIFLTNLQIGYSIPPIGMDLLIASIRFEKSVIYLYLASIPFIIILLLTLALITFLPSLSLMLIH